MSHTGHLSVLIVDDDPVIGFVLERNLELDGISAHQSHDGVGGLALATSKAFDVIVLDFKLPGIDGISVLRKLRASPLHGNTPIVLITADRDDQIRVAALVAGVDGFMLKPFRAHDLAMRILSLHRRCQRTPRVAAQADAAQPDAWVLVDRRSRVLECSPTAAEVLGLPSLPAGVCLSKYLEAFYRLIPSDTWDDLTIPAPGGLCRILASESAPVPRALEITISPDPGGLRLTFHDMAQYVERARQSPRSLKRP